MSKNKQQRMTLEKYTEIIDWLKANKLRIEKTDECTQLEVCAEAEQALGYAVPLTSIQKCAKIAKIKWAKSPPKPPPVPIDREAIIILISTLHGLYIETAGSAPKILEDLKSSYVQQQQKVERKKIDISTHDNPNQFINDESDGITRNMGMGGVFRNE